MNFMKISTITVREDALTYLFQWLTAKKETPFLAILGDFGCGKTLLCKMFVHRIMEARKEDKSLPIPFFIDLGLLSSKAKDLAAKGEVPKLEDILTTIVDKSGLTNITLTGILTALHQGNVFLIFDGFDEIGVHLPRRSTDLMQNIRESILRGQKGKIIITSRTHYFFTQLDELLKLSGGTITTPTQENYFSSDFRRIYLEPFDQEKIKAYLEKRVKDPDKAIEFIKRTYDLYDLAQRPFLLNLITQGLPYFEELLKRRTTIGLSQVYNLLIQEWLNRDEGKHYLTNNMKTRFMEELAFRMWKEGKTNLYFTKIEEWIERELVRFGTTPNSKNKVIDEIRRIDTDLRTATFLNRSPEGNYQFIHRSFMEFFLAKGITRCLSNQNHDYLDLPLISKETADFVMGIVNEPEFEVKRIKETLSSILTQSQDNKDIIRNSLFLKDCWDTTYPHDTIKVKKIINLPACPTTPGVGKINIDPISRREEKIIWGKIKI